MKNDYLKYFKPNVLVGLVLITGVAIYLLKTNWGFSIAVISTITAVLGVVATKLWRFKLFNWMFWVDDLSGRYEGYLKYRFVLNGELKTGQLKHIKLIRQNGYKISVTSFTLKNDGSLSSPSENRGMFVNMTNDSSHFRLVYHYLNEGSTEQGFMPHYGTEVLKVISQNGKKRLSGRYYTEREPQTKGEFINMEWVSDDLTHDF